MRFGILLISFLVIPNLSFSLSDEEREAREKILKEFKSARKKEVKETTELEQKPAQELPANANPQQALLEKYTKGLSAEQLKAVEQVKKSLLKNNKIIGGAQAVKEARSDSSETPGQADGSSETADNSEAVESKGSFFENNFMTDMISNNMKDQFIAILKNNPLKYMSDDELKTKILAVVGDGFAADIIKGSPNFLNAFVEWLKDDKALSALFGVLNKPDQMKKYGFMCAFYFVLGFILNLKNSKGNLLKRLGFKLCIMLGTSTLTLMTFFFLFSENVRPTLAIFYKHLL